MTRLITALSAAALCSLAGAQSISSFQQVHNAVGIASSLTGLKVEVNTGSAPTFMIGSDTYHVTQIFGVWALDDNNDMSATAGTQNGWGADSNYAGSGGIAGWKTNPNNGFVGAVKAFNFTTLQGSVEAIGYHVRTAENVPGSGNTLYIRPTAVPEPATMAALGLGAIALIRRRRSA